MSLLWLEPSNIAGIRVTTHSEACQARRYGLEYRFRPCTHFELHNTIFEVPRALKLAPR